MERDAQQRHVQMLRLANDKPNPELLMRDLPAGRVEGRQQGHGVKTASPVSGSR